MQKFSAFVFACVLTLFSGYAAAAQSGNPNYDASYAALAHDAGQGGNQAAKLNARLHAALLKSPHFKAQRWPSAFDDKLGTSTFLWAPANLHRDTSAKALAYAPLRPELRNETVARDYLGQQASYLRLDRNAIKDARVSEMYDSGSGPIIARFKQYKDGVEVFGRSLNVMMDRNLNAVATSGYFAPAEKSFDTKARGNTTSSATLGAESALASAFTDMGGAATRASFSALKQSGDYTLYVAHGDGDYHVVGAPQAKKVFYYINGKYVPAWYASVHAQTVDGATNDYYGYVISAVDGKVLFRKNLTNYDAYAYRVFADAAVPYTPNDQPINNNTLDPYTGGVNGDQGRTQNTANLVTLVNSGLLPGAAQNDPWLPPGTVITYGNNVQAYLNLVGGDGYDAGDLRGAASSANSFDYPYSIDTDPTTPNQRQAAIVNQFFLNNWMHDFWYRHGFNEAAGNAQQSNFGRGGIDGDPILAQGQDNSGRNNANMSTPPDGGSPIQRMYLFDGPQLATSTLTITQPPGIGALNFNTASFGPHSFDTTANVLQIVDAASATNGCQAAANGAALTGKIALIDRGTCTFKTKTLNAQNAGAVGVILANNRAGTAPGLGDDATITTAITIPTMSVSQADGNTIKTALGSGTVTAHMALLFKPDRDGTMDIQIIAHEFFHYVSNRLVGDALGLGNQQGGGMGEGWSDFNAMLLTVRANDTAVAGNDKYQGVYPLSEYVEQNQYFGIRRYPYSTDMSVNPLTFKHIANGQPLPTTAPLASFADPTGGNNAEVHNTGEVWCTALWEVYAALLNDPRYTFAQARGRMQDYIIAGLKMTPSNPTVLEARDALLAAARATNAADFTLMATAFAKRGMGVGAVAPDRSDTTNGGALESYVAVAAGLEVTDATLDFSNLPATVVGDADHDGVLDIGESARLNFTFTNRGTANMAAPLTGTMQPTAGVRFSNGGALTVPALAQGQSATVGVLVTLNSAAQAQALALVLAFPPANDPRSGSVGSGGTTATGGEYDTTVNYDEIKSSTSDDVEDTLANQHDWKLDNGGTIGPGWRMISGADLYGADVFGTGQFWFGPDNDHPSDISLVSPDIMVGSTSDFTLAFDHFFSFEFAGTDPAGIKHGYDGGVIEISTDGGTTWKDAFDPAIGGSVTTGAGYNGIVLSINTDGSFDPAETGNGHKGFVGANEDPKNPSLEHVVISFAKTLAGKTVRVRFREASDQASAELGWVVDNIAVTGASNKPFSKTVMDAGAGNQTPMANAGPDLAAQTGAKVTLNGSGSSDPYHGALNYQWSQTAGPATSLSGATSSMPTFTPDKPGTYTFALVVSNAVGRSSAADAVSVVVTNPPDNGGGAMGLELLLVGLGAAGLWRRRRR